MNPLPAIVAQLQAQAEFKAVAGALDFAGLTEVAPVKTPAAWVLLLKSTPAGNSRATGPALQRETDTLGVLIAVKHINDRMAAGGIDALADARSAVRSALHGYAPSSAHTPLELAGGDLVKLAPGCIWWMERFTTTHQEQASNG